MIFPGPDLSAVEPKPTALFSATASVSYANSWVSINGWSTPLVFTSVKEEYAALTRNAAVADFGALWRYIVRGDGAPDYLARVTTAPLRNLEVGESARGLILSSTGGVVDIIDIARLGSGMFLLTCSCSHARRLQLAARGMGVTIEDITGRVAALAIIGPEARDTAAAAGVDAASENLASQTTVRGIETAARPIHVGVQPGVEIIYPYEEALTLWERVRRAAGPTPAGLSAIDILRIEAGCPRVGVDFVSADKITRPKQARSPEALGLPHLAPANRAWFNGRRALSAKTPAPEKALFVLVLDGEEPMPGARVTSNGAPVGRITSAVFSPCFRSVVAFAELPLNVDAGALKASTLENDEGFVDAKILETAESDLATAFRASLTETTESRR